MSFRGAAKVDFVSFGQKLAVSPGFLISAWILKLWLEKLLCESFATFDRSAGEKQWYQAAPEIMQLGEWTGRTDGKTPQKIISYITQHNAIYDERSKPLPLNSSVCVGGCPSHRWPAPPLDSNLAVDKWAWLNACHVYVNKSRLRSGAPDGHHHDYQRLRGAAHH